MVTGHDDRCGSDDQPARLIYVWKVEYWIEKEETWLIVKIALLATTGYKERRGKTRKQRRTDGNKRGRLTLLVNFAQKGSVLRNLSDLNNSRNNHLFL